jgi:hypothetical protein
MDLGEIGLEDVDWIHLARYRDNWRTVVYTVMNIQVQWGGGIYLVAE